ncbi:MAG TPA: asparaginase [Gemmatimonadaceae bacterium]
MEHLRLDVLVTRGAHVESRHRVHAAIVDVQHGLIAEARRADEVAPWRSCAKPFQIMPLIAADGLEKLGWGDDQIALACASHGGEPEHIAIASQMLLDLGLEEGDLACGPHEPMARRGVKLLREAGLSPTRLHNNCSGKHAAMLARAKLAGWSIQDYEKFGHPVQDSCLGTVAAWTGVPREKIPCAVDGCGVVVFLLPLENMANAYARLARDAQAGAEIPACVTRAMRSRPFLVGGTDRFDTVLMEETDGRVLSKIGAEGVHSAAVLDRNIGIALKVEDGATRAQFPALLRALQWLQVLPETLPPRLAEFATPRIRNTRGESVGDVHVIAA